MLAAKKGDAAMVRAVGSMAPVALDQASRVTGMTALALAASQGHAECVKVLLELGADPNRRLPRLPGKSDYEQPPTNALEAALTAVRPWETREAKHQQLVEALDRVVEALLAATARGGDDAAVKKEGEEEDQRPPPALDLETPDKMGYTPLLRALADGRFRVAGWLLDRGARADAKAFGTRSAVACLVSASHSSGRGRADDEAVCALMSRLLDAGVPAHDGTFGYEDSCPVFDAAEHCSLRVLKLLLDAPGGADAARAQGPRLGKTALLRAALSNDPRRWLRLRILLEKGADASLADKEGRTPAFWAIFMGDALALETLLNATPPANPSTADKTGKTLLMHAASAATTGNGISTGLDCLFLLLQRGADARAVHPPFSSVKSARSDEARRFLGDFSAADYLLQEREGIWPRSAFKRAMTELIRAGAPIGRLNATEAMEHVMPSVLRATERGLRDLEARRLGKRRHAMETEEMVGLAFDFKDLWAAEAGVREREARVKELEEELRALGAGETTTEEEDDEEDEDEGEPMQTDEEEDAKRGDQDMEEEPRKE